MVFLGLFVGFWVLKGKLSDAIKDAADKKSTFGRMFASVENYEANHPGEIFTKICKDKVNIQGCSEDEQKIIFDNNVPNRFWFDLAYFLERGVKCSGISKKLDIYYFSDRT